MKQVVVVTLVVVGFAVAFVIALVVALEEPQGLSVTDYSRLVAVQVAAGLLLGLLVASAWLGWAITRYRRMRRQLAFDRDWVTRTDYF
jgi:Kef-type K+ transport system membrane component KefB